MNSRCLTLTPCSVTSSLCNVPEAVFPRFNIRSSAPVDDAPRLEARHEGDLVRLRGAEPALVLRRRPSAPSVKGEHRSAGQRCQPRGPPSYLGSAATLNIASDSALRVVSPHAMRLGHHNRSVRMSDVSRVCP